MILVHLKLIEAKYWLGYSLKGSVALFDTVTEIFGLVKFNNNAAIASASALRISAPPAIS